jgi:diguanylate cyclase (GGDEF)-like protein/PAS domain S-box-containing protein
MRVIACVTTQHDLVLVLLAAVICVLGALITMRLYLRSRDRQLNAAVGWLFLGAVAAGSTIWCTHFVAMIAYRPGVPVSYDPALTGASLAVAILASAASLAVARLEHRCAAPVGGALFGAGISAMHYTGMNAFGAEGFVTWDAAYVGVSVALASLIGAAAFEVATRAGDLGRRLVAGAGLLVLAIVSLHFTAMAAMTITPFRLDGLTSEDAYGALAVAVAGVGLLVLGTGLASFMLDRQAHGRARASLRELAESSVDGVVIVHGEAIVEVNAAFEALYGRTRAELIGLRATELGLSGIAERELVQTSFSTFAGAQVPVEIVSRQETSDEGGMLIYSVRDLRQRLAQERRIAHLARNDSLTGLPNRTSFLEHLDRAVADSSAERKVALLAIDLDRFKEINDLHGHAAGDHVLRTLGARMSALKVGGEFVARLGGDEFVATVTVKERSDALDLANRLEASLSTPILYEQLTLGCGASIGIAVYPDDAATTTALMNNADLAMYRAKNSLADRVCFYEEEMDEVVRARRKVTLELRDALARGEFELHYQLQATAATKEVTAYEALLRWKHPQRGHVAPGDFIPLAEETGLIGPLGEWVLRTACAEAAAWPTPHRLAVNISAVQLGSSDLPRLVHEVLIETGLPPSRLELEITETALIQDPIRTTHILRQLKGLGVSIAMDDFGVGYSSLSTLRAFPFDKIKLDKTFMHELEVSPQARAIIRAVLTIGESLGIPVLAEGVETESQLAFLQDEGCNEVQGFLLGRPHRAAANGEPVAGKSADEAAA